MAYALRGSDVRSGSIDLEQQILHGRFPPGSRLPSEEELAQEYGTTRSRIRRVLAGLARKGLVVSHAGVGWFVQTDRQAWALGSMRTFSEWCAGRGRQFGGHIVHRERVRASASEATLFGIDVGDEVVRYTRVRSIDDTPVMVEHTTWAPWVTRVVSGLADDVPSVYGAMAAAGVQIELGDHRIEAVAATSEDARLMNVRRSSPVFLVTRTGVVPHGLTVEVSTDRYIPGLVAFDIRQSDIARAFLGSRRG
ncbi:MAG: GntR family transcriptional regulator [Humibacter sp.]